MIYGSSKAGLSAYLEGLDHRFHAQGLRVVNVKPGFVKTGMTAGLPAPPFAGEPVGVARHALAKIDRSRPVVYTPRMWWLVLRIIRFLPRFVMRRGTPRSRVWTAPATGPAHRTHRSSSARTPGHWRESHCWVTAVSRTCCGRGRL